MKLAMVVPRYGAEVLGGAETLARGFAEEAVRHGWTVEVWTTCARSHYTWENAFPDGRGECQGVVVRRFPVTHYQPDRQKELDARLSIQGTLPLTDQYAWLESGAHSQPLYEYVAGHAAEFDVFVALPYASPLVHYAAWAAPVQVVLWPCLHDEPYAYMEPVRLLLESVWGVMFLSPEEKDLPVRCFGLCLRHAAVLGGGVTHSAVLETPQWAGPFDALLYTGRLEEGKNLSLLYNYVRRYADEGGNIRLIVLGQGPATPPRHQAFEYRGFVSDQDKLTACASTLALCQPSLNESFSISIMEAWLAARPVLVHGDCAVTLGHVRRSQGGLWFQDYDEFVGAVQWLQANPALSARMGQNGRQYVLRNYSWSAVVNRFEGLIRHWQEA